MSKPDWKDAPEWANWLAMDEDGMWSLFEIKPEFDPIEGDWFIDINAPGALYSMEEYATDGPDESGIDWDHAFDTLEERSRDEG